MSTGKMTVETNQNELVIKRSFDAPRELVFEAYTSCEHLSNWWGPRSWPMTECSLDFRVGGVWHYCLRGPNDGDESWGLTVYQEIVKPERIVYTDAFSNEDGNINAEMPQITTTLEFISVDGRTQLKALAVYDTDEDLQRVLEMGMAEGMSETLDRLEEYLVKTLKPDN